jgi:hypothetical protein
MALKEEPVAFAAAVGTGSGYSLPEIVRFPPDRDEDGDNDDDKVAGHVTGS